MSQTYARQQKYKITIKQKRNDEVENVGKVKSTAEGGQEVTANDYGDGPNDKVLELGNKIMREKWNTRYKKQRRGGHAKYWFYDCKCGCSTGQKFHKKTMEMLVRLHRKKCTGKCPCKKKKN